MLYSEVEDELAHFGVKGMKWGVRKAPSASRVSYKSAKSDRKEQTKLKKASYRGVAADRRAIKEKINNNIKTDPLYAKAVRKMDRRDEAKTSAAILAVMGGSVALPYVLNSVAEVTYKSATKGARYYSQAQKYNPNSRFWDGRTVPGEVVNIGAELARRYV